jgi:hypothetical protein
VAGLNVGKGEPEEDDGEDEHPKILHDESSNRAGMMCAGSKMGTECVLQGQNQIAGWGSKMAQGKGKGVVRMDERRNASCQGASREAGR